MHSSFGQTILIVSVSGSFRGQPGPDIDSELHFDPVVIAY